MEITLTIPDNKAAAFLTLLKRLGFVENIKQSLVLSEAQIHLIEEAREEYRKHPDQLIDWEDALEQIDWDAS